jgi:hypothetical protein
MTARTPVHQLRIYEIFEASKAAFHARFRDHWQRQRRPQSPRDEGSDQYTGAPASRVGILMACPFRLGS